MTMNFDNMMNSMMEKMMEKMQEQMMEAMMTSMMKAFGMEEKTSAPAEIADEKPIDPVAFFADEKPVKKSTEPVYNYDGISLVVNGWKTHCYTDKTTGEKRFFKRVEVYFDRPVSSNVYKLNLESVKSHWNGTGCKDKSGKYGFAFKDKATAQNFFMNYHIITK